MVVQLLLPVCGCVYVCVCPAARIVAKLRNENPFNGGMLMLKPKTNREKELQQQKEWQSVRGGRQREGDTTARELQVASVSLSVSLEFSMRFASAKFPPKTKQTKTNTRTACTAHTPTHTLTLMSACVCVWHKGAAELPGGRGKRMPEQQRLKGNAPCRRSVPCLAWLRVFPVHFGLFLVIPARLPFSSPFFFIFAAAAFRLAFLERKRNLQAQALSDERQQTALAKATNQKLFEPKQATMHEMHAVFAKRNRKLQHRATNEGSEGGDVGGSASRCSCIAIAS